MFNARYVFNWFHRRHHTPIDFLFRLVTRRFQLGDEFALNADWAGPGGVLDALVEVTVHDGGANVLFDVVVIDRLGQAYLFDESLFAEIADFIVGLGLSRLSLKRTCILVGKS